MPRKSARKSKSVTKKRKELLRFLAPIVLFILSVSFLGGLSIYRTLHKPFASADSTNSYDINNAGLSTLLLITVEDLEDETLKTSSLDLLIFDKQKKEVVSFDIPLNWKVDIPGRYGVSELSKVLPIAMMNAEDEIEAAKFLRDAVEKKFEFNVDRFLIMDNDISDPLLKTFKEGKSRGLLSYENLTELIFSVKTDATLSEFYNCYSFVNGLPLDRFTNYSESPEVYEESELIQTVLRDLTFDSAVATEGASVAVLNGTKAPGVASFSAEVLRNYGAHVTEVSNADNNYEESILVVSSKDLHIVKEIQRFFNVNKVVLKEEFSNDSFVVNRADVSLIIGLDTAEAL